LLGKIVRICDFFDCERSRKKTRKMTAYLPSIRQIRRLVARQSRGLIIREGSFCARFRSVAQCCGRWAFLQFDIRTVLRRIAQFCSKILPAVE
jgi:hypothetical protein